MNESRGRLCLHAQFAWPLFTGGEIEFTGGAEVQQVTMARGLARRGFDVRMVTLDYGQPSPVTREGITVYKGFAQEQGLPVLRFFHPRLTRTIAALNVARAEVYYARGTGFVSGITYDVAHARHAAFVQGTAADHDARRTFPLLNNPRDRWWARRSIRGAAAVIAQTEVQRRLYETEFGVASEVIPNLVELPARAADPGVDGAIVWLGTYKPSKRPEWFLELARRLPERRFVMCGVIPVPPETRDAWEQAQRAAAACAHLDVRGYVDRARLDELYAGASLFVHTSPAEGFSNTMLEAWARGIPSIVSVDPDSIIAREGLGEVVGDVDALTATVRRWMADPALRRAAGERAREYVRAHHAPDAVLERVANVFDRVVAEVRTRGGATPSGR